MQYKVFDIPDEKLASLKIKTFDAPTDEWSCSCLGRPASRSEESTPRCRVS